MSRKLLRILLACSAVASAVAIAINCHPRISVIHREQVVLVRNTNPLINAINDGAPLEEIKQIVTKNLELARAIDPIEGLSPLHLAADKRRSDVVDLLLKNGADPNTAVKTKSPVTIVTPLIYAVWADDERSVGLLINAGADIHVVDAYGRHLDEVAKSAAIQSLLKKAAATQMSG